MDAGIISTRYAKALLAFGKDTGSEEALYKEMQQLADCYCQFPTFRPALDNPIMSSAEKLNLLKAAAGNAPSKEYIRFAELVLQHKREDHLQLMALTYTDLYRKEHQIVVGSLTTASPLAAEIEQKMKELLLKGKVKTLEFSTEVDPHILGGFIFDYDTYRLDASVATQLKRVKTQLLEKNRKTV